MADNILNKSLSTKNTLDKLVDTLKVIERRKGVKECNNRTPRVRLSRGGGLRGITGRCE